MLFNSYIFFCFFPVVCAGFFLIARRSHRAASSWLGLASLIFYAFGSISALPLLIGSICFNYLFGKLLVPKEGGNEQIRVITLYAAVSINLVILGFFKYANFFIANANFALAAFHLKNISLLPIVLPIGISFFTFTQIAYLVDCWQGKVKEQNYMHYMLFVGYFPHLIAGPLLHHGQIMPQFSRTETFRLNYNVIAVGIVLFTFGLTKKLFIADPLGCYADVLFNSLRSGTVPMFLMSWFGTLAYTFQIYFDFSGYSDMAIGLSLFFGITLPVNFASPYQSTSIIEFWRRWHISLSSFLREYLYIPLGGNRRGTFRRYLNVFVTMLLGGLWHGAGWTFVLWGGVHGVMLIFNHGWRRLIGENYTYGRIGTFFCWLITFVSICFTWVIFRADSLEGALLVHKGMLGINGFGIPASVKDFLQYFGLAGASLPVQSITLEPDGVVLLTIALSIAAVISLGLPNLNSLSATEPTERNGIWRVALRPAMALPFGALLVLCIVRLGKGSPFLYFRF